MDMEADTVEKVCECLKANGGVKNTILLAGGIEKEVVQIKKKQILSISKYHDFEMVHEEKGKKKIGVRVRRQATIGTGLFIPLTKLGKQPTYKCKVMNEEQLDNFKPRKGKSISYGCDSRSENNDEPEDQSNGEQEMFVGDPKVFYCKEILCRKRFFTLKGLENHQRGVSNCLGNIRKESMANHITQRLITTYGISEVPKNYRESRKLVTIFKDLPPANLFDDTDRNAVTEGISLHKRPKGVRLNEKQHNYLINLFEKGMTGAAKKARADIVEKEMRYETDESGELLFDHKEWLEEQRIKRFFSAVAAKKRKQGSQKATPKKNQKDDQTSQTLSQKLSHSLSLFTPTKASTSSPKKSTQKKRKPEEDLKSPSKESKTEPWTDADDWDISDEDDWDISDFDVELEDASADLDAKEDVLEKSGVLDILNDDKLENIHPIQVLPKYKCCVEIYLHYKLILFT